MKIQKTLSNNKSHKRKKNDTNFNRSFRINININNSLQNLQKHGSGQRSVHAFLVLNLDSPMESFKDMVHGPARHAQVGNRALNRKLLA